MIPLRVIPCLDCRGGRVVKGIRFGNLRDVGEPAAQASLYEQQGADEIVLLDVTATLEGLAARAATVREVRAALSIPLTVGGGVGSLADARRLLELGADKVALNSAAVARPDLIGELAEQFGSQCVVLSVDAAARGDSWQVVTHAGRCQTGWEVPDWCQRGARLGAGEILLTSWDQDGTRLGYCLPLIGQVRSAVSIPIVASGGASCPDDFRQAWVAGADAALAASLFHAGDFSVAEVKQFLKEQGLEVRT